MRGGPTVPIPRPFAPRDELDSDILPPSERFGEHPLNDRALAKRWDEECAGCTYRNDFIIPALRSFIERHSPTSILDVGAASGYIARNVANSHPGPHWTLLDADPHRIDLARELCAGNFSFEVGSVFEISLGTFDLVLLSNTLLEFELSDNKLARLTQLANPAGWLVAVLPDTSADVVSEWRKGNDCFDAYARGNLKLNKEDKFTQAPYPFVAHRPIDVVSAFVDRGFPLKECKRNTSDGAFFFAFSAGGNSR